MEIVLGWIIFSVVAGWIASSKGRSGVGVFFLSLLLSPLVGIIVALVMSPKVKLDEAAARSAGAAGDFRKCPYCAEAIRREAVKCKHCGSSVEPLPATPAGSVRKGGA